MYLELVGKIKAAIPDAMLTTDIIVGFPGETDEQFEDTLSLVREVGFDSAYTFIYSPREGTPAAGWRIMFRLDVKKRRLQRLNDLLKQMSLESHQRLIGTTIEVLIEGESKNNANVLAGRTRTNKLVHLEGPQEWIGQLIEAKVTEAKTWYIKAEPTETQLREAVVL